jgi:hypothetical protein
MTGARPWRLMTVTFLVAASIEGAGLAQEKSLVPPVNLPERNPNALMSRQGPVEQAGPGAFTQTGAEAVSQVPDVTVWDRCRGRWALCKEHLCRDFIGTPDDAGGTAPLGASVYANARAQIANAEAAQMVLHHYDFLDGSAQLNSAGEAHLRRIAPLLPENFFAVVVERTPGAPELDERRRHVVFSVLSQGTFPLPAERVTIGPPGSHGLGGDDAELVHRNALTQTQTRGTLPGAGSGGFGGSGGGSGH